MAAISRKMTAASLLTDAIEILRQSLLIKRNAGQGSRFKTAFVRHFFNFDIWEQTAFKKGSLSNGVDDLENFTSEMEWSFFPSVFPVFFQLDTVTYQHRLRFRWRGFMYEFLSLIRNAFELCESTVDVTQR